MVDRVLDLARALRSAGVPVSVSESIDAMRTLGVVSLGERDELRAALAATMVKSQEHRPAFDVLFELYFGLSSDAPPPHQEESPETLREELAEAILAGDGGAASGLARRAVDRFGRIERSRDWYSYYEVARALDLAGVAARLEREAEETATNELERTLRRAEFERRLAQFRAEVLTETRHRVARHRGADAVAAYAVSPLPRDIALASATGDLTELRRAIRPLARKLATRVSMKRRRSTRGHVDVRKTLRHSLSTGGVPVDLHLRHRAPRRPELVILCDVSSSVTRFARFALMLTHSLSAQFQKVRSFAFVDTVDEVTRFFRDEDFVGAMEAMGHEAKVVVTDGHSDPGRAFEEFASRFDDAVGPKTTLLVLGDARTNYRAPRPEALRDLARRARHSYWLNPEAEGDWDTGDSAASAYAAAVEKMVEVRNLRQLERFIERDL